MVRTVPAKAKKARVHSRDTSVIKRGRDDKRGFLEDARTAAASMELKSLFKEVMDGFVSTVLSKVEERYIQQHSGTHLIGQCVIHFGFAGAARK